MKILPSVHFVPLTQIQYYLKARLKVILHDESNGYSINTVSSSTMKRAIKVNKMLNPTALLQLIYFDTG